MHGFVTILFVREGRSRRLREAETALQKRRGAALIELAVCLWLLSLILVSVAPLFLGGSISNAAANDAMRANALARDRLEQLLAVEFRSPTLAAGFHGNDLPATLPAPEAGRYPSQIATPFRRTWRIEQFAMPDDDSVPRGTLFTPNRVREAGVRYDYKRIDVTVEAVRRRPGLGMLAVKMSGLRSNPDPDQILSEGDADP